MNRRQKKKQFKKKYGMNPKQYARLKELEEREAKRREAAEAMDELAEILYEKVRPKAMEVLDVMNRAMEIFSARCRSIFVDRNRVNKEEKKDESISNDVVGVENIGSGNSDCHSSGNSDPGDQVHPGCVIGARQEEEINYTRETKEDILNDALGKWPKLIEFLENAGYYDAPAAKSHHGACWGGLFNHSLQVGYELANLTNKLDLKWQRKESPMIIGLLHDVCKLDDYTCLPFGETLDKPEIEWNKDAMYPGHGDKSLIMLMGYIDLTEEEKACIRYHMGSFTDKKEWEYYSRAVRIFPNILYTHMADMIASQIKEV